MLSQPSAAAPEGFWERWRLPIHSASSDPRYLTIVAVVLVPKFVSAVCGHIQSKVHPSCDKPAKVGTS